MRALLVNGPRAFAFVSALVVVALAAAGCPDPTAGATAVDLTVRFDEGLALDQLAIAFAVDGAPAFEPQRVPEEPTALDPLGARPVVLLFADDLGGRVLSLSVDGLAAGEVLASGDVDATLVAGAHVAATVQLGSPQRCGDGEPRAGREECDDGNTADGDGCNAACAVEPGFVCDDSAPSECVSETPCGDGTIDGGEQCDDGNADGDDGCSALCLVESGWVCVGQPSSCARTCGDGTIDAGEQCDDGSADDDDGCSALCAVEIGFVCVGAPSTCAQTCASGALDTGEACDDGNLFAGDGCGGTCAVETGFTCTGQPSACAPLCGDGFVRGSELCDDGAAVSADGCDSLCRPEPGFACTGEPSTCAESCGDGVSDAGEACDDGDLDDGDGCTATCAVEGGFVCTGTPSFCAQTCGNGELDAGEACDDGGAGGGDGCSSSCVVEDGYDCGDGFACAPVCGDGLVLGAEACDDDGTADGDGCDGACLAEAGYACAGAPSVCAQSCGDGDLDVGEACDDDGTAAGDGCSPSCAVEAGYSCAGAPSVCAQTCGDGTVDAGEGCDDGDLDGDDGCSAGCGVEPGFTCPSQGGACAPVCGDRLLRGAESCDDGDASGGDGCSSTCAREVGFICSGEPSVCVAGCIINGSNVTDGTLDPTNPCSACRAQIDATAYSDVVNGTACSDGAFCNGGETCAGGTCTAGAAPCNGGGSLPVCNEVLDACQCSGGSCDDGAFCNGGEVCASGACAPGLAPSCPPPSDICDESSNRCVECQDDGDCAPPNPTCSAGICVGGCSPGEHDGGDGSCVPDGTCAGGFARAFIDGDLDGVGAGALTADCFAVPLGAGLSATGTDCNDGDPAASALQAVFFDDDGDGFTVANAADDCVDAVLPATRSLTARPPPFVAFEAGANTEGSGGQDWSSSNSRFGAQHIGGGVATSDPDPAATTKQLLLTSWGLAIPPTAQIVGVRVHVRRRANSSNAIQDERIQLVVGSVGSGANRAAAGVFWPTSLADATYGGSTDLWGLTLTPAQLNASNFGVIVQARRTAGTGDLSLDGVRIEVFTNAGGDCNDQSSAVFFGTTGLADADADGFAPAGASPQAACVGSAMPAGQSQRSLGTDCFDASFNTRPNQASFFSSNRGDGSFDYNCNAVEERQSITEAAACACSTICTTTADNTYTPKSACGATTSNDSCSGTCATCALSQDTSSTKCR